MAEDIFLVLGWTKGPMVCLCAQQHTMWGNDNTRRPTKVTRLQSGQCSKVALEFFAYSGLAFI